LEGFLVFTLKHFFVHSRSLGVGKEVPPGMRCGIGPTDLEVKADTALTMSGFHVYVQDIGWDDRLLVPVRGDGDSAVFETIDQSLEKNGYLIWVGHKAMS
jgi:hypothetical protein